MEDAEAATPVVVVVVVVLTLHRSGRPAMPPAILMTTTGTTTTTSTPSSAVIPVRAVTIPSLAILVTTIPCITLHCVPMTVTTAALGLESATALCRHRRGRARLTL